MTVRVAPFSPALRLSASHARSVEPGVLIIGASTGGPQALVTLMAGLSSQLAAPVFSRLPVCVTLHMPRDLMPVIASYVARRCRVETRVVGAPCPLAPGVVYFAPGDRHLVLRRLPAGYELALAASGSRDFCQPAVDVMFASAAEAFGPRCLAVVLSGMGKDGLAGAEHVVKAGGTILVQDEASSAVWGMPGAVAKAGLAAAVLPPNGIAQEVVRRLRRAAVAPIVPR